MFLGMQSGCRFVVNSWAFGDWQGANAVGRLGCDSGAPAGRVRSLQPRGGGITR